MALPTLLTKVTTVLVVDRIEPVLDFWKRLDIVPTTAVPDAASADGALAFIILAAEGCELMYQTLASVQQDLVGSATDKQAFASTPQKSTVYIETRSLAEIETRLRGDALIMPRRTTFYGAMETAYTDPAGNIIVFAQHPGA
jgi:hypothetical protein